MANELQISYAGDRNVYAVLQESATGKAWNGSAFEVWSDLNLATYDIPLSSIGGNLYAANFPSVSSGLYRASYYSMDGLVPGEGDLLLASMSLLWNGSSVIPSPGIGATFGWATIAEADVYFSTRLGASTYWTATTEKASALATAYDDLVNCHLFTFPEYASGESVDEIIKRAQYEQALFLLLDTQGIDRRSALRSQGVIMSGLIRETYRKTKSGIAISGRAEMMLKDYWLYGKGFKYTSPTLPEDAEV